MMDYIGQELGGYRLESLIDQNTSASTYLGKQPQNQTEAAIKIIHAQLNSKEQQQFLSEAYTIAGLTHPNIVRIRDIGFTNDSPFLVMDYAPGDSLRKRHPRGVQLQPADILPYVKTIAGGLQFAHEHKVIHQHLKPEHILLAQQDTLLLSGFALGDSFQKTEETQDDAAYKAPEQINGQPHPMSDQYALGIMIYEWLSGDIPFQGSVQEIHQQHLTATPAPLVGKIAAVSDDLQEIITVMLTKEPQLRFQNWQAFVNAFEQVIVPLTPTYHAPISGTTGTITVPPSSTTDTTPVPQPNSQDVTEVSYTLPMGSPPAAPFASPYSATPYAPPPDGQPPYIPPSANPYTPLPPVGSPYTPLPLSDPYMPAPPLAGSNPYLVSSGAAYTPQPPVGTTPSLPPETLPQHGKKRRGLIGAIVAGVALGLGGAVSFAIYEKLPIPFIASQPASTPASTPTSAVTPTPTATPTATPTPAETPTATSTPTLSNLVYHGHGDKVFTVAWSPDGRRIASGGMNETVEVWDSTTGSILAIYHSRTDKTFSVSWSPDGTRIASGHQDGTVRIWDPNNGNELFVYRGHSKHVNAVAWSPNGQYIASASADQTVQIWQPNASNPFATCNHASWVNGIAWSHNSQYIVSGSGDSLAQVWQANTGAHLYTYSGHSNEVLSLAWSPDNSRIASASDDNTVQIWDASSGATYITYRGHTNFVVTLGWSSDGRYIVSSGVDTTVQVWNASSGSLYYTYRNHYTEVESVAWSPDNRRVASGSDDTTVQVWQIP